MVKMMSLPNGQFAGMIAAEITAVPFYELLNGDPQKANALNQTFFTQLISGIYRGAEKNMVAIELLFHSQRVNNQIYQAQVRIHLLIRKMGADCAQVAGYLENEENSLRNALENQNYGLRFVDSENGFEELRENMGRIITSKVLAVARKERVLRTMTTQGSIYYNDPLEPSENVNMSAITNAMTRCPGSAVSLQLIPTCYTPDEVAAIEQTKLYISYMVSNIRYGQGIQVDRSIQEMEDAYLYYAGAEKEELYYYNFIVYAAASDAADLGNRLIDTLEIEDQVYGSATELVDISDYGLNLQDGWFGTPWIASDILVFKAREQRYWGSAQAPASLIRFRYLMTLREIRSVCKCPVDDGRLIGLESRKIISNREKLQGSIIADGNFKVGIIQDTNGVHAGIPLNDFTKHGLIVGMPGSGKTNFSLGLLLQFWNDFHIPFLAIEPTKSEYRSLIDAIPGLQIFTPGKNQISPYIINPFLPPKKVTVESYVPSLMSAFKAAFSMPNPLPDIFLAAINECYNEYGWKNSSTVEDSYVQYFGMYEFIKVFKRKIQSMDYKGDVKSNMESAGVVRLVSLIEQNSNIYDNIHTIPLEDLLGKPTVIELNAINNKEQKSLIMALLLILICVYTKNNVSGDGKLKNVMLIDEAHVLLSGGGSKGEDSADSQGSTIEALEDMIAEIRSYGTSILIADQSPTKVGRGIVSNTNVKIIFKLVEKENKDAVSTATNMGEADYELLGRMGVGEAMLHYGRVYTPLHLKTYNVQERAAMRPVIGDEEIADLSSYWKTHQDLLIPHMECQYNCCCEEACDFAVKADADYLAARLCSLYLTQINGINEFLKFLVRMDNEIRELIRENPSIRPELRLYNCTKIKFLRKVLLNKNFQFSKADYRAILMHKNFLKQK